MRMGCLAQKLKFENLLVQRFIPKKNPGVCPKGILVPDGSVFRTGIGLHHKFDWKKMAKKETSETMSFHPPSTWIQQDPKLQVSVNMGVFFYKWWLVSPTKPIGCFFPDLKMDQHFGV